MLSRCRIVRYSRKRFTLGLTVKRNCNARSKPHDTLAVLVVARRSQAAAMSDKQSKTIQTLLEAEEAAKGVIDAARRDRDVRLKRAAIEADAEIKAYKDRKEAEYQAEVASFHGAAGNASDQIAKDAHAAIVATVAASAANKPAVVDFLVTSVTNVDTSF
jgi:V-type H+-transporting ATPase subunit G